MLCWRYYLLYYNIFCVFCFASLAVLTRFGFALQNIRISSCAFVSSSCVGTSLDLVLNQTHFKIINIGLTFSYIILSDFKATFYALIITIKKYMACNFGLRAHRQALESFLEVIFFTSLRDWNSILYTPNFVLLKFEFWCSFQW